MPSDNYDNYVEYKLVDIFETGGLWDQRFNTQLFSSAAGGFTGNDFKTGGTNAPWAWNDGNDAIVQGGEFATDPAKLADNYFDGMGNFHVLIVTINIIICRRHCNRLPKLQLYWLCNCLACW
jgi:hypothetical protein